MRNQEFEIFLAKQQKDESLTFTAEASEYSTNDRMHNFVEASKLLRPTTVITPEIAAYGMCAKHLVAVQDIIYAHPDNGLSFHHDVDFSLAQINEEFGGLINYIKLIQSIIIQSRLPFEWSKLIEQPPF